MCTSRCFDKDLAPNNLLFAEAVERCAEKGGQCLAYALWLMITWVTSDEAMACKSLTSAGISYPNLQRKTSFEAGLHRGWKEAIARQLGKPLKNLRRRWYELCSRLTDLVFETLDTGAVPVVANFGGSGDIVHPEVLYKVTLTTENDIVAQMEKILTELAHTSVVIRRKSYRRFQILALSANF